MTSKHWRQPSSKYWWEILPQMLSYHEFWWGCNKSSCHHARTYHLQSNLNCHPVLMLGFDLTFIGYWFYLALHFIDWPFGVFWWIFLCWSDNPLMCLRPSPMILTSPRPLPMTPTQQGLCSQPQRVWISLHWCDTQIYSGVTTLTCPKNSPMRLLAPCNSPLI